jgi:hypothetical protein
LWMGLARNWSTLASWHDISISFSKTSSLVMKQNVKSQSTSKIFIRFNIDQHSLRLKDFDRLSLQKANNLSHVTISRWNWNRFRSTDFIAKQNYYLIFSVGHRDRISGQW